MEAPELIVKFVEVILKFPLRPTVVVAAMVISPPIEMLQIVEIEPPEV